MIQLRSAAASSTRPGAARRCFACVSTIFQLPARLRFHGLRFCRSQHRRPGSAARRAFGREARRLRGFIRRRVADVADADDIVQDVFSELIEATRLATPIEHLGAWLFRVARNRIIDRFRREARAPRRRARRRRRGRPAPADASAFRRARARRALREPPAARRSRGRARRAAGGAARSLHRPRARGPRASRAWPPRAAPRSIPSSRASATRCSICASGCGTTSTTDPRRSA